MTFAPAEHDAGRLKVLVSGPVARIVFDNPARLNAMRLGMWQALGDVCAALAAPGDIRVVVVEGAGTRAFVSGADISEFGTVRSGRAAIEAYDTAVARAETALAAVPVPTIAKVRGYCVGGGLGIAVRCDMRLAAEDARFAVTPAKLGIGYGLSGVAALVRLLGHAVAGDLLFSARQMAADEALHVGLVNRVVPGAALEGAVDELAAGIAQNAPLTIRALTAALNACNAPPDPAREAEVARLVAACYDSADYREGQAAFAEKRKPRFTGH